MWTHFCICWLVFVFSHLAIVSLVAEGGGDAVLDGFDPGLTQLLRVCLHHTTPVRKRRDIAPLLVRVDKCGRKGKQPQQLYVSELISLIRGDTSATPGLTWWVTPPRNRSAALCPHSVWLYRASGPPPPLWGCPKAETQQQHRKHYHWRINISHTMVVDILTASIFRFNKNALLICSRISLKPKIKTHFQMH